MPESNWQARATLYRQRVNDAIPAEWRLPPNTQLTTDVRHVAETSGVLTPHEVKMLQQDATSLAAAIAAGKHSAVEIATAYCKSAAVAHQTTNCLMDFFPEAALEQARELDAHLKATGKPVGPLHGVPVSVKDMFGIRGRPRSGGYLSVLESPEGMSEQDATVIAAFRAAGAVFFCKTTNPQAIMHLETNSFLGETTNPFNTTLTPGGSSGGEAALIAAGGSVLGIGSDIGGSIRNPCGNCALYGFKPTAVRLPKYGNLSGMPGQESIVGAIGPMAVTARDCELWIKVALAGEPWKLDPTQVKMPWKPEDAVFKHGKDGRPRIGVMWHDGVCELQPPMKRALRLAVDKLKAAGFDVVDYAPHATADGWALLRRLYFTDGGERIRRETGATGEPILPLTAWIMEGAVDTPAIDVMALVRRREAFRTAYNEHWEKSQVDVVLTAPYPGPAPQLGTSKYWMYTAIFNLVDYPGGVFPTPWSVEAGDVAEKREYLSEDDRMVAEFYSPDKFVNAPLSLQVVGPRWEDEMTMEALKIVSKVVRS